MQTRASGGGKTKITKLVMCSVTSQNFKISLPKLKATLILSILGKTTLKMTKSTLGFKISFR